MMEKVKMTSPEMKQVLHIILYIVVATILTMGCEGGNVNTSNVPQVTDTLYTEASIWAIYDTLPERALTMIDSAEVVGNMTATRAELLRAIVYSRTIEDAQWLDTARIICERLLAGDSAKVNLAYRQDVLEVLVSTARMQQDDEMLVLRASQLANLCREQGFTAEALRNESEIGLALSHLNLWQQGLAKIDSVLAELNGVRHFNELDASVIAIKRKIAVLQEQKCWADVIPVAQGIVDRLSDYEQHPGDYHDGTYREPADENRQGYIDFYRSQAYSYIANAYANMSEKGKAIEYLSLFEQSDYSRTFDGRKLIMPTLCLLGEYDKMEAVCRDLEAHAKSQGDTVSNDYSTLLRCRADAAKAQGRIAESLRLHEQHEAVKELLHTRQLQGKAHLYAARYHAQEQQRQIVQKEADTRFWRFASAAIAIGLLLAVFFALYYFCQKRNIAHKNRILAAQIDEAVAFKKQVKDERSKDTSAGSTVCPDSLTDEQLFEYLKDLIEREQLFLNSSFERQNLIDLTGLSKERIGTAFSRGSSYDRLTSYIRELRLEFAVNLMNDQPDLTTTQVALASGFTSPDTFTRYFKAKYSMTPTIYRQTRS